MRHLREIHDELDARPALELFHEAQHHRSEGQSLYALGQLDLAQRARLDDLFYAIAHARARAPGRRREEPPRGARRAQRTPGRQVLRQLLRVRVDAGRVGDRPGVPDRADRRASTRRPTRRGVIADLTCDSDGSIDTYVEAEGLDTFAAAARAAQRRELPPRHSSWSARTRRRSATSTTCSATPTRSTCAWTAPAMR